MGVAIQVNTPTCANTLKKLSGIVLDEFKMSVRIPDVVNELFIDRNKNGPAMLETSGTVVPDYVRSRRHEYSSCAHCASQARH